MKSIELLSELLAGKKIVRGDLGYEYGGKLKDNYFVYDDGSSTKLEDFLRFTLNDWRVVPESISFKDLNIGDKFYFAGVDKTLYQKAYLNNGSPNSPVAIALAVNKQQWSYATNDVKVVKC